MPRGIVLVPCALAIEARPLVRALGLRRAPGPAGVPWFSDDRTAVLITGPGKVRAAAAVGAALVHAAAAGDAVLGVCNVGCAGGAPPLAPGLLWRAHKVVDAGARRDFYPDALVRLEGFAEGAVITVDAPCRTAPEGDPAAFDMEAAGVCAAAAAAVAPHRLEVLKVISDQVGAPLPTRARVQQVMEAAAAAFAAAVERLYAVWMDEAAPDLRWARRRREVERWCAVLRLTATQRAAVRDLARRRTLAGAPLPLVDDLVRPPADKGERNRRYARLCARLEE